MEAVKTKSKIGKIRREKHNEVHSEIIKKENVSQCDLSMSLSLDKKDDCKKTVCMVEEVSQKKSSSFTNVNAENSAVNVLEKKEELASSSSEIKCDLEILHSCTEETVPQSSKLSGSYNEAIFEKTQDNFEETCMSSSTLSPPETYCSSTFARLNEQLVSECQTTNSLHLVENFPSPISMKLKIYPSLEGLHHDITSFQVLVKTHAKSFETKIVEINKKCLQDFIQAQDSIEKHELFDLLNKFERIRKESADSYKKLKNMESQLKRKKKNLWNTVTKKAVASGKCEDGNTVHTCLTYNVIELDKSVTTDIEEIFRKLEDTFLSNISFYSYVNQLVRLQIEQYVYELLTNSVTFANKSTSSPLAAFILAMPPQGYSEEIDALKKYISILFHFQRQPFGDKNFINITRNILTNLVALLLRSGTIEDSLFLVNHVVRCPSGISSWAVSYVQLPLPPLWSEHKNENSQIFGCDYLDYCLVVLQMLLNPILHREDFLKYLKSASSIESSHFVILDSDGEEEEDELQFCNEWTEADIISLLDQIPFKRIFEHVLCISFKGTRYDASRTTEEGMQKLFGFATFLIDVMYGGLKTYNVETYPLLIEMLGRIIRQTLGYVSDHWHNYKEANISLEYGFQAEYDRFFFHTMYNMVILHDVGTWEFLSYLPYCCVSPRMLWNLLWIFYSLCKESSEEEVYSAKDVDVQLKSDTVRLVLQEKLIAIGPAESLHLLHTFRTMALATEDDKEFVCFVTKEIFESSFVNDQLRAKVEKDGRVIISTIVEKHPFVVSFLIKEIVERDDSIGNWAVNLFKEVDLSHWIPEPFDIEKFSEWLLCGSLSSPKNQLTRLMLKKLNWGSDEKGLVFLPMELHRQIGLLVVQAYAKYDGNANNWVVSKGIEQMLQFCATVIGQNYDADQSFVHWAWELLFSLKLHVLDQPNPPWVQIYDGNVDSYSFPDIYKDLWLHPLQKSFEDKQPAACFLTLVMTNISCSVKSLTKHGLEIISILVEQKQYAAAIHSLYHILPFFVKQVEILTSNSRFMLHVYDLIVADLTSLNIIGSPVVGAVLKNFAVMMKNQIFQLWNLTVEHANPLLKLWIELLVKLLMIDERRGLYQTLKGSDNQVYYLLDVIIQIGFIHTHTRNGLLEKIYDITKTVVSTYSSVHKRSIWSVAFGSSEKSFSILRANSLPGYPWFMFCIILAEANQKENVDLWLTIQQELISDATLAPEVALKRASSTLKISCCDLLSLPIYRWCLQTIHTPVSHPILPLLLQQFFLYYFHGTTCNTGLLQCSSINRKFFCESRSMKMLSDIKDKLREACDFYSSCLKNSSTKLKVLHAEREKYFKQGRTWEEEIKLHEDDFKFYEELLLIFQAFSRWIDDPQLHKTNICLPALEPNYCIPRLELILKHDQRLWVELLRVDKIKEKLEMNNTLWHQNKTNLTSELTSIINKPSTATERIMERFKHHSNPLPMPSLEPLKAPVSEVNDYMLSSWDMLVKNIEMDQKIICQEAQKFEALLNKVKELNATYQSLIPHEYSMLQDTVVQKKTCNKPAYGSQECAGAAVFHLSVKKIKKEERVSQRIEKNRLDYHILLNELSKPPPNDLSSAAMRLDNFVRTLIKKARSSKGQNAQILRNMGVSLFYYQLELTEKAIASATNYAPSRQCFTSSIEVLGREFIEGQEDQCFLVAKTILRHPSVAGLASPFFNPNISSVSLFLSVYEDIAEYVKENSINAVVVLLSKIDLQKWLNDKQVPSFDRKKLFMKIGKALMNCEMENTEFLPAYELFKKHFKIVLLYQFPEHYDDAIHFLLSGMETKSLNVDMWYEMFRCLGCVISTCEPSFQEVINAIRKFALNQKLTPDQQLFVFTLPLHLKQVIQTLDFLYQYFSGVHQSSQSKLYEIYKAYLKPLSVFLGMLSHCLMDLYSEEKVCSAKQLSSNINYLWEVLYAAFSLWIDPVEKRSCLVFPWDIHEEDDARMMFEMFTSCLRFHHEHLFGRNFQKGLLSHLWNYYVRMYVKPGLRNYSMVVCHSAILTLPWHEFYPSADDIDKMCTVLQCEIPESREFLAEISMKIPWIDVVTSLTSTSPSDIIANTLCILGKLLIMSGWELAVIKTNSHQRILKSLENLAWHYLFPEMVGELLDLYSSVSNAVTLLLPDSGNSPDVYVLEFLKTISGMVPSTSLHSTCAKKQSLFLNKHTAHLSSCVNKNINNIKCQTEKFNMILPRLLQEVEIVVLNGIEPSEQINYAIPLVKEILGFLNSITDPFLGDQALASVVTWLNTSRSSPLLLPCLNVACCSLICMEHMVSIIECCITARFEAKLMDPNEALEIWCLISSCFQIPPPKQEDFITASVKFNSHLTLFIYVLHRLPQASTVTSKIWLLKNIVNWNENSEPKENMESKLILLWDKILEIGLQLTAENEHQVVQNTFLQFCGTLSRLGEDKSQIGLLAAVGFGKPSTLSVNFRFLCRAMAAYIYLQMPEKGSLRLELHAPGFIVQEDGSLTPPTKEAGMSNMKLHSYAKALRAFENLRNLASSKSYAALKTQVDCAVDYCVNSNFCLVESRLLLKELALQVFPTQAYLYVLNTSN